MRSRMGAYSFACLLCRGQLQTGYDSICLINAGRSVPTDTPKGVSANILVSIWPIPKAIACVASIAFIVVQFASDNGTFVVPVLSRYSSDVGLHTLPS